MLIKPRSLALWACICPLTLAACASNPERPVHTVIVPVPSELTQPIPEPQLQGDTNSALIDWIERLRAAIAEANRRLASISNIK